MLNPFEPGYHGSEELRKFGFGGVGENVQIARNCTIVGLANIFIGNNVRIDSYTVVVATTGRLFLGNHIHIGGHCHLLAADDLNFGDFSGISQGVRIYTANDDYTGKGFIGPMVPSEWRRLTKAPVSIGRYGGVGSGSVLLPGSVLGEGTVVGAQSLVTKPLAPWGVYFGAPVKRIKNRSKNFLTFEKERPISLEQ
ncbi:MAG: acyltransferase [Sphingomicrobium sp.]